MRGFRSRVYWLSIALLTAAVAVVASVVANQLTTLGQPYPWVLGLSIGALALLVIVLGVSYGRAESRADTETPYPSPDAQRLPEPLDALRERRDGQERAIPKPPDPYFAHYYPLQENFTGRVARRRMLSGWLSQGERPVFALIAMGGMGKSALAWAWLQRDVLGLPLPGQTPDAPDVAQACRVPDGARPEGVMWWSFYDREGGFATFLDRAVTYAGGGSVDPATIPSAYDKVVTLVNLLRERCLLLVLDGFERELRAYAGISAAYQGDAVAEDERGDFRSCTDPNAGRFLASLAAGPLQSRVLLTTRHLPRDLDDVAGCRPEELTAMEPEEAVAFFRAQGVVRGTRAEIEAACEPYGYLPLALRLLSGVIVRDKRKPGDITVAGRYPVLPELKGKEQHHILEVSYEALDKQKRTLLSRIAAFRSPMGYDALRVLNPYKGDNEFDAALDELLDRGLLLFDKERASYDLHAVVRQHAYDRLRDKKGTHMRLRGYFADVPQPDMKGVQSAEDLAPVIELYHHTAGAGRYDDAHELFRDRLHDNMYYRFPRYQACVELVRALFPEGEDRPPRLAKERDQAWAVNELGNSYALSGQSRRAVPLFQQLNGMLESRGDKRFLAGGLGNLALSQVLLGELAAAEDSLRRSIELCRDIDDEFHEAMGRHEMGRLLAYRSHFDTAVQELDMADSSFSELGRTQSRWVVSANRAQLALLMGDAKAALEAARRARELADEVARSTFPYERDFIWAEWLIGAALVALASEETSRQRKLLAEAESHLTEALTRCRRINLVELEPDILLAWARWHHAKGNAEEARAHAREAIAIADRCEHRLNQAEIHNFFARLALDQEDRPAAAEHAAVAYERAWCDGPPHCYKPALDEAQRLLKELGVEPPQLATGQ